MTESQSVSVRRNSVHSLSRDRLSDLPLSIIHTILSSLPIKHAIRTSILSRQWRYTWTSLPKLVFISNAQGNQAEKRASEERLKEFISYALSIHEGSLRKFKLDGIFEEPCPHMDEWLIRLSTKDIRKLTLLKKCPPLLSVHSSIYSCNKLTCLQLLWCDVGPPPSTFKGFSFLRNLTLRKVKISNATAESLVSNSPLLERLQLCQLTRDESHTVIRVHAPNLKYLLLQGYWTDISLDTPLLAKMGVVFDAIELQRASFCNYTNFLGGCTNLEELIGLRQFTKVMSVGMDSWNPNPLVFHRLRTIVLDDVDFRDVKQQSVLARLLVGAPNLQFFMMYALLQATISSETQDVHSSGFRFESNLRMEKLRVVKMGGVRGLLPEIKLIEFFLEKSPLLETMSVFHIDRLGAEENKDLTEKIFGCTPASQTAKISISGGGMC